VAGPQIENNFLRSGILPGGYGTSMI